MTVPSGTQSGQTFRLSGLGAPRLKEGGNGDLYVSVNIRFPERVDEESKNLLREFEHRNAMRPRENMTGVSR
jgi:molecular chaperone DnaJ